VRLLVVGGLAAGALLLWRSRAQARSSTSSAVAQAHTAAADAQDAAAEAWSATGAIAAMAEAWGAQVAKVGDAAAEAAKLANAATAEAAEWASGASESAGIAGAAAESAQAAAELVGPEADKALQAAESAMAAAALAQEYLAKTAEVASSVGAERDPDGNWSVATIIVSPAPSPSSSPAPRVEGEEGDNPTPSPAPSPSPEPSPSPSPSPSPEPGAPYADGPEAVAEWVAERAPAVEWQDVACFALALASTTADKAPDIVGWAWARTEGGPETPQLVDVATDAQWEAAEAVDLLGPYAFGNWGDYVTPGRPNGWTSDELARAIWPDASAATALLAALWTSGAMPPYDGPDPDELGPCGPTSIPMGLYGATWQ